MGGQRLPAAPITSLIVKGNLVIHFDRFPGKQIETDKLGITRLGMVEVTQQISAAASNRIRLITRIVNPKDIGAIAFGLGTLVSADILALSDPAPGKQSRAVDRRCRGVYRFLQLTVS